MKTRKRDFVPFSFYDLTGMAAHLEKRAAEGWMIEKLSNFGWIYRAMEPRKLHFTVTYYPKASEFDPEPGEDQLTFHDFCAHSGWKLAASSGQLQVFFNDQEDPVPIETDPDLELAMIGKVAKKALPVYFLMLIIGFFMGGGWVYSLFHEPIDLLSNAGNLFTGFCWLGLFLYFSMDLISYFVWHRRARRAAQTGNFVPTHGHHRLMQVFLVLAAVGLVFWFLAAGEPELRWTMAAMLLAYAALILAVNGVKQALKRKKVSATVNLAVTLTVDIVLALVLMAAIFFGLLWAMQNGIFSLRHDGELPLTVEDLTGSGDERYIKEYRLEESVFLSRMICSQYPSLDAAVDLPWLEYTVIDVKVPVLYDFCLDQMVHEHDDWGVITELDEESAPYYQYEASDPAPWGAAAAYQMYSYGEPKNWYLLCWEDRIVELRPDWALTAEQMAAAGRILGTLSGGGIE